MNIFDLSVNCLNAITYESETFLREIQLLRLFSYKKEMLKVGEGGGATIQYNAKHPIFLTRKTIT